MKKPTLEEIRRALILDNLITYREFNKNENKAYFKDKVSQKEICRLVNWYYVDHETKDPADPKNWPVKPIQISKTLKGLEKDGLIIKEPYKTPGKGPAQNLIFLKKDYDTLFKIIKEYNNPIFEPHYRGYLGDHLLNSPYGYELVNMDLVEAVLKEYKNLNLEPIEKKRLLDLIKISPSALFTFIEAPYSDELLKPYLEGFKKKYLNNEQIKKALFLYILNGVGLDFTYRNPHSTPWKVEYEVNIKFSNWKDEDRLSNLKEEDIDLHFAPYLKDTLSINKNTIKMTSTSIMGGISDTMILYKPFKDK
ncbi:MAG TPA: hypothetical protein PKK85_00565 [Methanobacteriaceae archaeon]|nr:hypothetical protein [Methanobacteriaceae archaeon]